VIEQARQLLSEAVDVELGHVGSSGGWPTALGQKPSPLRHSSGVVESPAQQHLDMGIEAAELIGRPLG
jgi:hypothetical protein